MWKVDLEAEEVRSEGALIGGSDILSDYIRQRHSNAAINNKIFAYQIPRPAVGPHQIRRLQLVPRLCFYERLRR
jgi:hypothetical protein